jgi:hypothetical protein
MTWIVYQTMSNVAWVTIEHYLDAVKYADHLSGKHTGLFSVMESDQWKTWEVLRS